MDDVANPELLARVVRRSLPATTIETITPAGPSWNRVTEVGRVTFTNRDPVYCKLTPDEPDSTELCAEAGTLEYVGANLPVTVPAVVGTTMEPVAALVTEPVAGTAVTDEWFETTLDRRVTLAERLGRTLATIHHERFARAGEITGGDADSLTIDNAPWPEVLRTAVIENRRLAPTDQFSSEHARLLDAIDAAWERLADSPARLLHCDPATPNCFTTGDDRLTLLDWGNSVVGDPVRDLIRAREQVLAPFREPAPDRLVTALHCGYRSVTDGLPPGIADRGPIYAAMIQTSTADYVERFAEWHEESVSELTAWFHEDLERRLSLIE